MTHAIALSGPWEGLRALPRTLRTPYHRRRLELGLERIDGLYEQMAARAALLKAGLSRLDGLRAGMIDQLDAIDGDADFEPSLGASELRATESQAFSAATMPLNGGGWTDAEDECEDEGAACDDEGFDVDGEDEEAAYA